MGPRLAVFRRFGGVHGIGHGKDFQFGRLQTSVAALQIRAATLELVYIGFRLDVGITGDVAVEADQHQLVDTTLYSGNGKRERFRQSLVMSRLDLSG